ncbi:MAG: BACON domain-containing protein [Dehalococcoidia bacterium]
MVLNRLRPVIIILFLGLAFLFQPDSLRQPAAAGDFDLCPATGSPLGPFNVTSYDPEDYRTVYNQTFELAAVNRLFAGDPYFGLPPLETGPRAGGAPASSAETAAASQGSPTPTETVTAMPEGSPTPTTTVTPTPSPTPFPPMSPGLSDPYIPPTILKAIGWIESTWSQAAFSVPYGGIGPALVSRDCGYGIMQVTTGMQNTTGQPTREQFMVAAHFAYNIARGARILADKWNLATEFRPIVADRNPQVIEDWYYAIWSYNGFVFLNHPLNPRFPAWPRTPYSCGPFDDGFGHDRSQYPYQELVLGCMAHPPTPGGVPLWQAQEVTLPDLSHVDFAEALKLENFACDTSIYCFDNMDMPRPADSHVDPTQVTADRSLVVGSPVLAVSSLNLELTARPEGLSQSTEVTISNPGTGVLPWRAIPSASWLQLSPGQGLALGTDLGNITSTLTIQANLTGLPKNKYVGTITLEAPYAGGSPKTMTVTVNVRAQSFLPGITKS